MLLKISGKGRLVPAALIGLICLIALLRVVATYPVLSHTWDEPHHIAAGMQWLHDAWLDDGIFVPGHPPLAQSMFALGPKILGVDNVPYDRERPFFLGFAGVQMLFADGRYWLTLSAARAGNLPFLVLALAATGFWAWRAAGWGAAVLAVLTLSLLPPVLGHAGVAALDIACAATTVASFAAFAWFLSRPRLWRAMAFGGCAGVAFLTKISTLPFLVVGCGLMYCVYLLDVLRRRRQAGGEASVPEARAWLRWLVGAGVAAVFVVWLGYGFQATQLSPKRRPHQEIDVLVGDQGFLHDTAYHMVESVPLPMPDALRVLKSMFTKGDKGHLSYFRGEIAWDGSPMFLPTLLSIKLPMAFIALVAVSVVVLLRNYLASADRRSFNSLLALAACLAILLVGIASGIANGVRQVLAMLPLLSIIVGCGATRVFAVRGGMRAIAKVAVISLFSWLVLASVLAHPNYLSWFNPLAGEHPEALAVDSDLDWGQDLGRLGPALAELGVDHVWIKYNGSTYTPLERFGLPQFDVLPPDTPVEGWVAISVLSQKLGTREPPYDQFSWLDAYSPAARVGDSILVYRIP